MVALQIRLFGETRVLDGDRVVGPRDFGGVKPRQVLEVLALHAGHPVTKDTLIDSLWGENAPGASTATLEAYVSVLRRRIEPNTRPCASVVHTTNGGYLLDPTDVRIDLHEFQQLLSRPKQAAGTRPDTSLSKALELASDDLLESEPYVAWAIQARASVHGDIVSVCERAGIEALAIGEWSEAMVLARRALTLDPLAETCGRNLIEALWRDGRRAESLRAYETLRRSLADELGTDPDGSTQALHLAVLRSPGTDGLRPAGAVAGPEVTAGPDGPIADEVLLDRLVGDVVRTVSGLRSSRKIFIDTLMTRIAAELVAS